MLSLKMRALKTGALSGAALLAVAAGAAPALGQTASPVAPASTSSGKVEVNVLSSRYDLISGGDALVEVKASDGARAGDLRVWLNGRELAAPLSVDPARNALRGLVTGLDEGANWLQVSLPTGRTMSQPLVNHPITGPIVSGPHLAPYECRTVESGLGEPTDADCSAPTRHAWFYRSTGGEFKPLPDPKGPPPPDTRTTTTIDGKSVPYIVRVESGVINRAIYRLAVLDDPRTDGFRPDEGWNGRLAVTFGGGSGTQYN